jgi:hypothetical protein
MLKPEMEFGWLLGENFIDCDYVTDATSSNPQA